MRIKLRQYDDDRANRLCDVIPDLKGDVNISYVYPGSTMLWHRHRWQSDYQLVIKGSLKIGLCNYPAEDTDLGVDHTDDEIREHYDKAYEMKKDWVNIKNEILGDSSTPDMDGDELVTWPDSVSKVEWHVLTEQNANQGSLYIPRGLWHGCHNFTNDVAILMYYITNKWNGKDEDRCDPFTMGHEWKKEVK